MPVSKKSSVVKSESVSVSVPVVESEPVSVSAPKKRSSKKEVAAAPVESVPVTETVATEGAVEATTEKKRKVVTKEYIEGLYAALEADLESMLADSLEKKVINSKRVRGIIKQVKAIKTDSAKVSKQKRQTNRVNTQSGFMKPVKISKELAKFTGWAADQPKSRIEVTKFLCKYVKDNNLQNPADKRQIVPDAKLAKLLSVGAEDAPLTYPGMQKKIQPHFSNL
jgi:chromatin remodeling complex protein RSC6